MQASLKRSLLFLSACSACACSTTSEPYPPTWDAPASRGENCGYLTGEYGNTGGGARSFLASSTLTSLLLHGGGEHATRVGLSVPRDDVVQLVAYEKAAPSLSTVLDDVGCEKGTLVVRRAFWDADGAAAGPQSMTLELTATEDWLVVRVRERPPRFSLGYPSELESGWHRFRRIR
jgi:hypothetical protein